MRLFNNYYSVDYSKLNTDITIARFKLVCDNLSLIYDNNIFGNNTLRTGTNINMSVNSLCYVFIENTRRLLHKFGTEKPNTKGYQRLIAKMNIICDIYIELMKILNSEDI